MPDRRGVLYCLAVFLAARVLLSLLGWAGIRETTLPPTARTDDVSSAGSTRDVVSVPGPGGSAAATPGLHNLVDGTERWDAGWFLFIVREGYPSEPVAAFFPGYPVAVDVVDAVTPLGPLGASLLVSNLSFLGAILLLYRLTIAEYGDDGIARRSIALLTFFPTSFFFLSPYAESTYLLATVGAFAAARSDRWIVAGLSGAVGWATRSLGGTLVPALLVEAWFRPGPGRARRVVGSLLPAIGLLVYLAWWWQRAGDPFVPIAAQSEWLREPSFPVTTLVRGLEVGARAVGDTLWLPEAGDLVLTLVPIGALVVGWRHLPSAGYAAYATLGLLAPLSFAIPARPLLSMPRFVIVLFPIAWAAAAALTSRTRFALVMTISVLGWIGLSLGFMNWRFVA